MDDLIELSESARAKLEFIPLRTIDDAFELTLMPATRTSKR